jgi:hypothetical protein
MSAASDPKFTLTDLEPDHDHGGPGDEDCVDSAADSWDVELKKHRAVAAFEGCLEHRDLTDPRVALCGVAETARRAVCSRSSRSCALCGHFRVSGRLIKQIAKAFLTQLFEGVVPTVPFADRYEGVVDTFV